MLNWSKLKADDKINVNEKLNFGIGRVENIVGKGQNAGYHHFLLFPQCFQRLLSHGHSKLRLCGKGLKRVKMKCGPNCGSCL